MSYHTYDVHSGFVDKIPVRNIWLLLLYASQLYRELRASRRVELEEAPDQIPHLVAEILANAVERRLRRGLSYGYRKREADLNRVRGRIDLLRTMSLQMLQLGRVACQFDELTVDTARHRYVKAALVHVATLVGRLVNDADLEKRCRDLASRLERAGVIGSLDPIVLVWKQNSAVWDGWTYTSARCSLLPRWH